MRRRVGNGMNALQSSPILIDQVYQRLLEAIVDCTLRPGERIRQGDIADQLGVSRQPVSHALHLLKRQGLVQDSGRKGFEVTPIDPVRIRQLYEVRGALDGQAAHLAAQRAGIDPSGRRALEDALAAGQASDDAASVATLVGLDTDFHRTLYRLAGNPVFEEMVQPHWPHLRRSMATVLDMAAYRSQAWTEHAAIVAHVLAGKAGAAEEAARNHAVIAGRTTEERIAGRVAAA